MAENQRLTRREAVWATQRKNLPYYKIGNRVWYDLKDLKRFLQDHRVEVAR